jgi:hypothetical protein
VADEDLGSKDRQGDNAMTYLSILAGSVAAAVVAMVIFAPRDALETEVHIDASPDQVWSVLADGARYRDWNPFIQSMDGDLAAGSVLTNRMTPSSGQAMTIRPRVMVAEPGQELRWQGRLGLPRIMDAEHYFILTEEGEGTRLIHGERFHGVLMWAFSAEQFRGDFDAMNAALKSRVEADND